MSQEKEGNWNSVIVGVKIIVGLSTIAIAVGTGYLTYKTNEISEQTNTINQRTIDLQYALEAQKDLHNKNNRILEYLDFLEQKTVQQNKLYQSMSQVGIAIDTSKEYHKKLFSDHIDQDFRDFIRASVSWRAKYETKHNFLLASLQIPLPDLLSKVISPENIYDLQVDYETCLTSAAVAFLEEADTNPKMALEACITNDAKNLYEMCISLVNHDLYRIVQDEQLTFSQKRKESYIKCILS